MVASFQTDSFVTSRWHSRGREQCQCYAVGRTKNTKDGKVLVDYELDINYKPEGPVTNVEPVTWEVEEEDSNTEYAKTELLHRGHTNKE